MSVFWILLSLEVIYLFTHVHTVKEAHIFMLTVMMSGDRAEGHIGQVGLSLVSFFTVSLTFHIVTFYWIKENIVQTSVWKFTLSPLFWDKDI